MLLKERVAIVTGSSSGIGRGIALEFAREGAKVIIADLHEEPKQGKFYDTNVATPTAEVIKQLGSEGLYIQTDMGDETGVQRMIEQTIERFGGLDILVNNAGIHIPGDSQELSVKDWDKIIGINLRGIFLATKFSMVYLKQSNVGRIINISSIHAFSGGGGPGYAPAKAGVVNMTRDIALEVGQEGLTVNAICPGFIETPIQDYLTEEQIEMCRRRTPLPRFGTPRDIGRACVFLASDDAEWITGAALPVDGGWLTSIF